VLLPEAAGPSMAMVILANILPHAFR